MIDRQSCELHNFQSVRLRDSQISCNPEPVVDFLTFYLILMIKKKDFAVRITTGQYIFQPGRFQDSLIIFNLKFNI